jgi:hypothetical protein
MLVGGMTVWMDACRGSSHCGAWRDRQRCDCGLLGIACAEGVDESCGECDAGVHGCDQFGCAAVQQFQIGP